MMNHRRNFSCRIRHAISLILSRAADGKRWYYVNEPSATTPDGFRQEQIIREIWAVDATGANGRFHVFTNSPFSGMIADPPFVRLSGNNQLLK